MVMHMHRNNKGFVVWLTGLSGAGKSTIALSLEQTLVSTGEKVEVLDGDMFRKRLGNEQGFSRRDRVLNMNCMGHTAQLLSKHGVVVILAAISPYREVREYWKREIKRFIEVYVNCPLEVCISTGTATGNTPSDWC